MEFDLNTIITTIGVGISGLLGFFIRMQKEYNDKLKISYDEKIELLNKQITELKLLNERQNDKIEKLNTQILLLQEVYEINIPVIFHRENGEILFTNKSGRGIKLDTQEFTEFFKKVKKLKQGKIHTKINNNDVILASCTKSYPLEEIFVSFVISE